MITSPSASMITTATTTKTTSAERTLFHRPTRLRRHRLPQNDKLMWASRKNIVVVGVPDRGRRYLSDFYTTLIEIRWRWNLLFFVVGFVLTWLVFAVYYYLLCFLHGDLDPSNMGKNSSWVPCVMNVQSFTEAYLFSIETMSTIGYGWRYQTEECAGVYLAVIVQSVIGAGLQFALASLVVSKTRRANRISQTILFSNTAVIYREDNHLKLAVRIGDMRKGNVIGAHATGMLIKKTMERSGHKVPVRMFTVPFDSEGGKQKLFLCWPCLLVHTIDQHSPFWTLSRDHLRGELYELIVILDGISAATSKPFQARKSYHASEIVWGHRFRALTITHDHNSSGYIVDYANFHLTYLSPTSFCSAQMLERRRLLRELSVELGNDQDLHDYFFQPPRKWNEGAGKFPSPISGFGTGRAASFSPQSSTESRDEEGLSEEGLDSPSAEEGDREGASPPAKSAESESEAQATDSTLIESLLTEQSYLSDSVTSNDSRPQSGASNPDSIVKPASMPTKNNMRKISRVEFDTLSLSKGTPVKRRISVEDATNMYRHRKSVTDTYLGTELPEDDADESGACDAAILSIIIQQSRIVDGRAEARDVLRLKRRSTTQPLLFATGADPSRETLSS